MNYIRMWSEENHNYFDLEPALINFGPKSESKFGYGIKEAFMFGRGFHAEFYLSEEEIKRNYLREYSFFMNRTKFRSLISEIRKASDELFDRMKSLLKIKLENLSNEELWEVYDLYGLKLGNLFVCYSMTQPHKIRKLEEELISFLKGKTSANIFGFLSTLTSPKTKFTFTPSGNELFKSFSETIQKESVILDKSLLEKNLAKEEKQSQGSKRRLLLKLNAPKKIEEISDVLSILAEERMKMRFVWMKALYYNDLLLSEIKRRFNISKRNLRMYDFSEVESLVKTGKKLSLKKLKIRELGFIKIINNGQIETLEGEKACKFMEEINSEEQNVKEITGMVASRGKAVGRVVLLSYKKAGEHSEKIKNMKRGEIVVTEMTRPNIIPACEKAGAIITDEGGVLSHAAIVSRELQIPCVIGTQISTSVLRDGDYVEVDAEKGMIRKINLEEYGSKKLNSTQPKRKIIKEKKRKLNKKRKEDLLWFSDIGKEDLLSVGGKGANLGELSKFMEVPNGFCISVLVYEKFIRENGFKNEIKKILSKIDVEDNSSIKKKSEKIKTLIMRGKINKKVIKNILSEFKKLSSKKVAVRSSATAEDLPSASFAGQQDTYLNVDSDKKLIESVKKCWASLFNERAIYYREKKNFSHLDVSISVVVQGMINPLFSGVMFTKDPLDKKDVLIEMVKGIGERLVSGEITPNSYLISGEGNKIINRKERFKIDETILLELVSRGKNIEKHYGEPQDVEWAIDKKGNIFILQSRPITT